MLDRVLSWVAVVWYCSVAVFCAWLVYSLSPQMFNEWGPWSAALFPVVVLGFAVGAMWRWQLGQIRRNAGHRW